jgi:GNAT superfamily N-acetyltransferase
VIDRLIATEDVLRRSCGAVGRGDGFAWFRSDELPRWLMGTGIRPDDPASRPLGAWEVAHDEVHAGWTGRHHLIELVTSDAACPLIDEARAAGYETYDCLWMARPIGDAEPPSPADPLRVAEVVDAAGLDRLIAFARRDFEEDLGPDADPARFDAVMEAEIACMRRTPVRFLEVIDAGAAAPETLARGGVFALDGLARLQSIGVRSDVRRRGLGRVIVEHLAGLGRRGLGCDVVGVSAERGDVGHALYAALGFEAVGEQTYLIHRPEARA